MGKRAVKLLEDAATMPAIATSSPAKGILHGLSGDAEAVWQVPEEVPIAVQFNSQNYAVMMGTPADFEDFAVAHRSVRSRSRAFGVASPRRW